MSMAAGMSELAATEASYHGMPCGRSTTQGPGVKSEMNATGPLQDSTCLLFLASLNEPGRENGMDKLIVISR